MEMESSMLLITVNGLQIQIKWMWMVMALVIILLFMKTWPIKFLCMTLKAKLLLKIFISLYDPESKAFVENFH